MSSALEVVFFSFSGLDGIAEHDCRSQKKRAEYEAHGDCDRESLIPRTEESDDEHCDGDAVERVPKSVGALGPAGDDVSSSPHGIEVGVVNGPTGIRSAAVSLVIHSFVHELTLADSLAGNEVPRERNRRSEDSCGVIHEYETWTSCRPGGFRVDLCARYGSAMPVRMQWTGHIGEIVIDRPDKRNAVDLATLTAILDAQREAADRRSRVLVVRGAPPAFCSGADLDGAELGEFTDVLGQVLRGFGAFQGLTVAYVAGPALGAGLQIAAACDVRIATPESAFGIPAAKLGLAVDAWTVERLAREVGWSRARAMLLTGDPLRADELASGFVWRTVTASGGDEALAEAMAIVTEWSQRAPLTIAAHKLALERAGGADISSADVETARLAAWSSNDAVEGRTAFRERRPPMFDGR